MAIIYECTTSEYARRHGIGQTYAKRVLDKMVQDGAAFKLHGHGRGMRSLYMVVEVGDWFHDPFNLGKGKKRIC